MEGSLVSNESVNSNCTSTTGPMICEMRPISCDIVINIIDQQVGMTSAIHKDTKIEERKNCSQKKVLTLRKEQDQGDVLYLQSHKRDLNSRPTRYECVTLPTELLWRGVVFRTVQKYKKMEDNSTFHFINITSKIDLRA